MTKKAYIFLFLILFSAFLLRFVQLDKVPLSLNWDETTFAINSYSILQTGKDEYGVSHPLIFKSIGDYKNPLLIYLMVPFIKIFGLNEFGIRIPSALFGTLSVLVLFFLVKEVFGNRRAALISAFILAVSPWHLQFSRAGLELPISLFLVLVGSLCFILGMKKDNKFFIPSAISFSLALYSYYSDRFFVPLLLLSFLILFYRELFSQWRKILVPFFIGCILLMPLILPFFSQGSQEKMLMTTIFGYRPPDEYISVTKQEDKLPLVFQTFHNPIYEYSWMIVSRYFNHFSPSFLFFTGSDDNRQLVYGMGMIYLLDLPFLIWGVFNLFKRKDKLSRIVIIWLLLAPLPAAITRSEVHPRRAFEMVIPLAIVTGLGFNSFLTWLQKLRRERRIVLLALLSIFFAYSISFYLLSYYIFTPLKTFKGSAGWQYGYKQLVSIVSPIKNNYNQVIVDTTYQGPYSFFLFYEKYPPQLYQSQAKLVYECTGCLGEGYGYDNYIFRPIYWPADKGLAKTLFAGPPERLPEKDIEEGKARILDRIYFPDGTVAFYVVETF